MSGLPIPPEGKDGIFEQMGQLFIDTYEELVAAMEVMKRVGIDPENRKERVEGLQMRYAGIIEKYQDKMFREQTVEPEEENVNHLNEQQDTLFIIDLDGVVFNSEERFARARKSEGGKTDWSIAFNPDLLLLDTLIEGTGEAIEQLESRGDTLYLTSRPESLYHATWARLTEFHLSGPELICKPDDKKYTKTVKWKADEVQEWAGKYKRVIFIDDEPANRQLVEELGLSNVTCYESLAQALEAVGGKDIL